MSATEHKSGSQESKVLAGLAKQDLLNAITEEQKQMEVERLAARLLAKAEAEKTLARQAEMNDSASQARGNASGLGRLMLLAGLVGMAYFLFLFDVSWQSPGDWFEVSRKPSEERIVNLGRLNDRQVGAMVSGFVFLAGVVTTALSRARPK